MSKLKRHATFSTGTRPKLSSLASAAAAAGSGGGAMRKAASVDFANVPEIMTTPTPSPSVGRRTPGKWNCVQTDHTLKTTVAFDYLLLMTELSDILAKLQDIMQSTKDFDPILQIMQE